MIKLSTCVRFVALLFISFGFLLAAVSVSAQFHNQSWTTDDGLPQNTVYSISQTRDGYLWLATLDGLARFDGVKFTVFNKGNQKNLPGNRFVKLFAETDGTLWICTEESGLIRYHAGEFQVFTTADGLLSNRVHEIQKEADGSLLISTEEGTVHWRDGKFSVERRGEYRSFKVYLAASGNRWEMDAAGFRLIAPDGRETRLKMPFDPQKISTDRTYNSIGSVRMLEDSAGTLWITAAGEMFELKNGEVRTFSAANKMPSSLIKSITEDRAGVIWVGTLQNGVCRLRENNFECFGKADGLSSNNATDVFVDRENTVWVGTNDGGINHIINRTVTEFSTAQGLLDKNIYPILEDHRNGGVWLGAFSALSYYKDGKVKNYARRDGLLYEIVQSLFEDADGRLWIGSVGGIEYLENGKFHDFIDKLNIPFGVYDFWDIHRDRRGTLWFATSKGLIRYRNGAAKIYTTADNLPSDDVKIVSESADGSLWVGTYGGLAHLTETVENGESAVIVSQIFTEKDGLNGNQIRSIHEDADGTMWIGTYDSGLSRLKNGVFTGFTTENGLFSNGVFQILPDERGNFWMSSNQGIFRVKQTELNDFADGKIAAITSIAYGKSDGMLNTEANGGRQPAGIKTSDGRLWFPTQNGAAIINPEYVSSNPLPPPVVIENIKINFQPNDPAQAIIELQPNQNNLEIVYTGLSFIKPEQVKFKYKLENLDAEWTNAGTRREVFYPYLPPGDYTFRVIAANSDGVWNEIGAAVKISVLPPFYRTYWFAGLIILSVAVIVFLIYKRRVIQFERRQKAQEDFSSRLINAHEAERRRVAGELHDSIGQTLAMIKNRAVFGAETMKDLTVAREQFDSITSQTTQAISEVREISYNLRPYLLERLGLTKAIKSLVNKFEEVHLLKVEAQIDDIDNLFHGEAEMSVYRIVQESLNNVAKHADTNAARLTIKKANEIITIKIEDGGRGFDRNAPPKTDAGNGGFGLLGITERVRMLGGTLEIESANGKGTKLTIKIRK